jgi:pyridoxamine 5'-phosphate oxidase
VAHLDCGALEDDPITQFRAWFEEARAAGAPEPEAMTLATADAEGRPSARTVLLRGLGADGFRFYTNYTSRKGRELAANPYAALVFRWVVTERQVVVAGEVSRLSAEESDAYFASRPRESRISAWASDQSAELASREELVQRVREVEARFAGLEVPRPEQWGGYLLEPRSIELWQQGRHRLHDRCLYVREGDDWRRTRLSP